MRRLQGRTRTSRMLDAAWQQRQRLRAAFSTAHVRYISQRGVAKREDQVESAAGLAYIDVQNVGVVSTATTDDSKNQSPSLDEKQGIQVIARKSDPRQSTQADETRPHPNFAVIEGLESSAAPDTRWGFAVDSGSQYRLHPEVDPKEKRVRALALTR